MKSSRFNSQQKQLLRRYLLWAYKSTRESFERIERKTTQLLVDEYVLANLGKDSAEKYVDEFKQYIQAKKKDELELKYTDAGRKAYHPHYLYLKNRLQALEKAIAHFLGAKELKTFEVMFEGEFTRRILESKDH